MCVRSDPILFLFLVSLTRFAGKLNFSVLILLLFTAIEFSLGGSSP